MSTDPSFSISSLVPRTMRSPRLTRASDGKPLRRLLVTVKAAVVVFVDGCHGDLLGSVRLGVTGRNRTGTGGVTSRGSAVELRPRPSARLVNAGLGGRTRTCGLMLPKHARCLLRHTELKTTKINGPVPRCGAGGCLRPPHREGLAPRARLERATSGFVGRRSGSD
jgi:hypothetical protein